MSLRRCSSVVIAYWSDVLYSTSSCTGVPDSGECTFEPGLIPDFGFGYDSALIESEHTANITDCCVACLNPKLSGKIT
eukprot:COSAG02_NODE_6630_length_3449_cov_7.618209_4_plen_78_part_00